MNILPLSLFFILGSIIGSFLNVVLFRYNTGRTVGGRSKCFSCKRTLSPIDLIPVFSYFIFGGKCRTCRSRISFQYPAVELLTGSLFAGVYYLNQHLVFLNNALFIYNIVLELIVMTLLVLIAVYDFRHKIIPDAFAYTFAIISFIALFVKVGSIAFEDSSVTFIFQQVYVTIPDMSQLFAGIILAFPFYFLWLISRGGWMGLGDAKLALGIGWFLGLAKGTTAIIYGFWLGALLSVLIIVCRPETSSLKRFLLVLMATFAISLYKLETIGYYWIAIFVSFYFVYALTKSSYGKTLIQKGVIPNLSGKSEIPFAPFLIAGLLIVYFFGYNAFSISAITL